MLGTLALVAVVVLVAIAVLAQIPFGSEEPLPEPSSDQGERPHRDYLLSRGWDVDQGLEFAPSDAPVPRAPWSRTEDGLGPHTFSDALLLQLTEDVERLGATRRLPTCATSVRRVSRGE